MKRFRVLSVVVFLISLSQALTMACQQPSTLPNPSATRTLLERLIAEVDFSTWVVESFKISPDNRRMACAATVGNKWFVIVDGVGGKEYDGIGNSTPIFSPDSKRVAYAAAVGSKSLVVVDGVEGEEYDAVLSMGIGKVIFDSPNSLHYLAVKGGNSIYLMEERLK